MPRFAGIPVDTTPEAARKPRFAGVPVGGHIGAPKIETGTNAQDILTGPVRDVIQSAGSGLRSGVETTIGALGDVADINSRGTTWLAEKLGVSPEIAAKLGGAAKFLTPGGAGAPTTEQVQAVTTPVVGEHYQPQTRTGKFVRTAAEFLPAAALGEGNLAKRAITQALLPALGSETAGQATEGTAAEPYARIVGALASPAAEAAALRAVKPAMARRLTVEDLKAAGGAAYKRSEAAGVIVNRDGMQSLGRKIIDDFTSHGFAPENEPGAAAALKAIVKQADGNVTLEGLDTLRKTAANGYRPGMESNNALIGKVIGHIDELVNSNDPAHMVGLDTKVGTEALAEARSHWHRARKLETVEGLVNRGELNAGSSGSGGNVENATRQQIKRLLTNDRLGRGFTKQELAAARKAVLGSKTQNLLRLGGKLSPEGNGLMMAMHVIGGVASGGSTIPLALAGYGAKKGSEALTRKSIKELTDLIARGGKAAPKPRVNPDRGLGAVTAALLASHH